MGEGIGFLSAILEPIIVLSILVFGVYINRRGPRTRYSPLTTQDEEDFKPKAKTSTETDREDFEIDFGDQLRTKDTALWRRILRWIKFASSPQSTLKYSENRVSRFLANYPFIFEVFYLLLTYWVYQLSRAFVAYTFVEDTKQLAVRHAISLVHIEESLGIYVEPSIQKWFLQHTFLISCLNRIYSFIHIPATCAFFGWLFYTENVTNYSRIRRTMALCNSLAFVVFTLWPCAPPRFLPEEYGFVDTIHKTETASVWTSNRFQNQFAAMPSLHFGYSFIIGCSLFLYGKLFAKKVNFLAFLYPATILLAIIATGNHFILDAIGGFFVACFGITLNRALLYLVPVEQFILYGLHIHKPVRENEEEEERQTSASKEGVLCKIL